jgi:hypothetical protein
VGIAPEAHPENRHVEDEHAVDVEMRRRLLDPGEMEEVRRA